MAPARTEAPEPTVTTGEWKVIGRDGHRNPVRPITITISDPTGGGDRVRVYYELPAGQLVTACRRCGPNDPGTVSSYRYVLSGVCFECGGHGLGDELPGGLDAAITREKRLRKDQQTRERRRLKKAAAKQAAHKAWRAENTELVDRLNTLVGDVEWSPNGIPGVDRRLYDLAYAVRTGTTLTDKQTTWAAELLAEHDADQAHRARQRHAGTVDQPLTVTGTVAVAIPVDSQYGSTMLIVIEGAGADEGITAKTFSGSRAARNLQRGDEVTVTGTVKQLTTYQDIPQTELARPKFTVTRRADTGRDQ